MQEMDVHRREWLRSKSGVILCRKVRKQEIHHTWRPLWVLVEYLCELCIWFDGLLVSLANYHLHGKGYDIYIETDKYCLLVIVGSNVRPTESEVFIELIYFQSHNLGILLQIASLMFYLLLTDHILSRITVKVHCIYIQAKRTGETIPIVPYHSLRHALWNGSRSVNFNVWFFIHGSLVTVKDIYCGWRATATDNVKIVATLCTDCLGQPTPICRLFPVRGPAGIHFITQRTHNCRLFNCQVHIRLKYSTQVILEQSACASRLSDIFTACAFRTRVFPAVLPNRCSHCDIVGKTATRVHCFCIFAPSHCLASALVIFPKYPGKSDVENNVANARPF